jgi:AraC-like DNA-binding protein
MRSWHPAPGAILKKRDTMVRRKVDPPRGVLKTMAADRRRMRHERYHPSPDLEPYVEHYWVVEWDLHGQPAQRAETLPHPSVHMIFEPGGRSCIRGAARAKFSRVLAGRGGVFAVKFTPGGFHPFARVPVSAFTDRIVTLRRVFGADGDAVNRAILAERSDRSRIAIVERFLRARNPQPDERVVSVAAMAAAAAQDRSILKVDDLVERFGMNKRTLQRLFVTYVGVGPKWVIQRYRLHEAAEQLTGGGAAGHAALALQLGYSDQAHFVRDFKAIVGMSPALYARAAARRA